MEGVAKIAICGAVIYGIFFGLGVGYAIAFSFTECQKVDTKSAMQEAAWWALNPLIAWCLVSVPYIRLQFDKFFMMFGLPDNTAIWVSFGYALMLACMIGFFGLRAGAISSACVPTIDEANAFRKKMLDRQKAHDAAIAASQEKTPAVKAL